MKANYGYKDGSGDFYITIDTDLCNGCGECVTVCPAKLFAVQPDENDPLRDVPTAVVAGENRNKLKYACAACKPISNRPPLPCMKACKPGAIQHSW
ncbi:MAG: 4Fe-4S binding protein [Planctomycetes bacterium]|nr:4Fe-4S binding protein [Planctomycetota bacterium]